MKHLLCFDPGKNTGWSRFIDGQLVEAGLIKDRIPSPHWSDHWEEGFPKKGIDHKSYDLLVLIECPRWYPAKREIDVNDLIDLAVRVGELKGRFRLDTVELVFPRSWKGTLRWDICCERVLEELTEEERAVLPRRPKKKDVQHDVLDAVGLGLWKLGRFGT